MPYTHLTEKNENENGVTHSLLFIKLSSAPFHETFDMNLALISSFSVCIVWFLSLVFVRLKIFSALGSASAASFIQTSIHGNIGYIGLAVVFYSLGNSGLSIASFLAPFIIISQLILSVLSFNIYSRRKRKKIGIVQKVRLYDVTDTIWISK